MVTKRKGNQSELAHLSWDWINVGDGAKMLKISYEEERKKEVRTLGDLYMQSFFPKLSGVGYKSCLIYVELGVSWDSWFLRLKWNCINPKWHIPVFLKICAASRGCGFPHSSFTLMSCLGILPSFLLASRPGLARYLGHAELSGSHTHCSSPLKHVSGRWARPRLGRCEGSGRDEADDRKMEALTSFIFFSSYREFLPGQNFLPVLWPPDMCCPQYFPLMSLLQGCTRICHSFFLFMPSKSAFSLPVSASPGQTLRLTFP